MCKLMFVPVLCHALNKKFPRYYHIRYRKCCSSLNVTLLFLLLQKINLKACAAIILMWVVRPGVGFNLNPSLMPVTVYVLWVLPLSRYDRETACSTLLKVKSQYSVIVKFIWKP